MKMGNLDQTINNDTWEMQGEGGGGGQPKRLKRGPFSGWLYIKGHRRAGFPRAEVHEKGIVCSKSLSFKISRSRIFLTRRCEGLFVSFSQKRNGIVFSSVVNYLHSDL